MRFANGLIFTPEGFVYGGVQVEKGRFARILPGLREGDVDLGGGKLIPGLVDLHIHGAAGADFSDGDMQGLRRMAAALASHGVTGFLPASMSLPQERLAAAFETARQLHAHPEPGCARVLGIHMEGPFFSREKRGAQNPDYLKNPDFAAFLDLYRRSGGLIRLVDLAPELPGAEAFIQRAKECCTVSVAHTEADYERARAAFRAGARHLTHLFNAMPPLHHREPGPIGAGAEREDVTAELICDGLHVHPSAVRLAFRLFPGRICLVSDALRCCGLPEGEYELGDQRVRLSGGVARLADGTIAGAATYLLDDLRNAVDFGVPEVEAIRACTLNPARVAGVEGEIGAISEGKRADFLLCGEDLRLRQVYLDGEPLN